MRPVRRGVLWRQYDEIVGHHPFAAQAHGAGYTLLLDEALDAPLAYALALGCFFGADWHMWYRLVEADRVGG